MIDPARLLAVLVDAWDQSPMTQQLVAGMLGIKPEEPDPEIVPPELYLRST